MNQLVEDNIENLIYEIRGQQVMLDSDLAKLYGCKNGTKEINQAVKNNIEKFPERFSFKITSEEVKNLLVKNFDQKIETRGGKYKNPRVFTEQGVAMLSTILKSKIATQVSIRIMDAFVNLRKYVNNYEYRISNIETKIIDYDNKFDRLFEALDKKEKLNHIFFEGQIYDAYSLLVDILKEAESEIIIIDNYIDKKVLDIISLLDKETIIVTNKYNNLDIEKYKKQYNNLKIIIKNNFHDRYIIVDRKILYHFGSSLKDIGNKCFSINKISDKDYLERIIDESISRR